MIALIQRVTQANVVVDGKSIGEIDRGVLALIGIERDDDQTQIERLLDKLIHYRIFEDESGKMNRSVSDICGGLLLVPQFTLAADTKKGRRPSFDTAAEPDMAQQLFNDFVARAQRRCSGMVQTGRFGAQMQVSLTNDGPVTFWLQV